MKQAIQAIESNGALRSALRRAVRCGDAVGHRAVDSFGAELQRQLRPRRLPDDVADAGMILLAQSKVDRTSPAVAEVPPPGELARHLGEPLGGGPDEPRRRLSALRFQRLLRASDSDDRLQLLRRAMALLPAKVHPLSVLEAWLDLHDEGGRRRFARAYFNSSTGDAPATSDDVSA
ncbi:type I-E CRISPR-associated protein Cse2/CasB [Arenimonas composti]|uniref:CRISPR-associated protein Cse2 n=1 Tax=Arenimonas composti TR7-09 = DSM 18010 TaxID=1121013 RepID=A0A091BCK8_9GAMM|nr:type I-E CRISPR-associated protein Cse2/CasB [Arenimonas composti]KFN49272.1 hypothetical protein P873_11540 [Arenimonas composti TR7-09 = DSM 18010]